jgi:uncharacterized OB-fold protein
VNNENLAPVGESVDVRPEQDLATSPQSDPNGPPRLVGSRRHPGGNVDYPARTYFDGTGLIEDLGTSGELYSYTTVYVSSSRPTPYVLGYVDLDGGTRILADLDIPAESLSCGLPVRLTALHDGRAIFSGLDASEPSETAKQRNGGQDA